VLCAWVFLVATHAAAAGWTQPGGGPDHAGVADVRGPLDVIGRAHLVPEGFEVVSDGAAMAVTPYGLTYVVSRAIPTNAQIGTYVDNECALARWLPGDASALVLGDVFECDYLFLNSVRPVMDFGLVGYDEVRDELLVCAGDTGGSPLRFHAAANGELLEQTGPFDWDLDPTSPRPFSPGLWTCRGGAIDAMDATVCLPFDTEGSDSRVAVIDLATRVPLWDALFGPASLLAGIVPGTGVGSRHHAGYVPLGCTATTTGYTVVATHDLVPGGAFQNFDRQGNPTTSRWAERTVSGTDTDDPSRESSWMSIRAASRGEFAAFVWHDRLIRVDPSATDLNYDLLSATRSLPLVGPVAWGDSAIVAPADFRVYIRTQAGDLLEWMEDRGYRVLEVMVAADGTAWVLQIRPDPGGVTAFLSQVELGTARTLHRLDLPTSAAFDYLRPWPEFHLHALGDGQVLLWDRAGEALVLGRAAAAAPLLRASDVYPPLGTEVTLAWQPTAEVVGVNVGWGDGTVAAYAPDAVAAHRYYEEGDRTITVTVHHEDGTSASAQTLVHVGQEPPIALNLMQRAFADDKVDTTWGIIGLVVVLVGGIVAVGRRRRHHSVLQDELAKLRDIRADGIDDPAAAARSLEGYERRIASDLATRRLTDAQFSVLRLEVSDVRRTLRKRAVAPMAGIVSPAFRLALDAALEDGRITGDEADALLRALRRERGLPEGQRARVRKFIQHWTTSA
jgi:hypothetical protein